MLLETERSVGHVLEHDNGGQVVDLTAVGVLLCDGLGGIHLDPFVGLTGPVVEVPVDDLKVSESGSGDGFYGSVGDGEFGEEIDVGGTAVGVKGDSHDRVPHESVIQRIVVGVVQAVVVAVLVVVLGGAGDGVELAGCVVLGDGVIAEVGDGAGVAVVTVVQGDHGGVDLDVVDAVAAGGTYSLVETGDLLLGELGGEELHTHDVGQALRCGRGVVSGELGDVIRHVLTGVALGGEVLEKCVSVLGGQACIGQLSLVGVEVGFHYADREGCDCPGAAGGQKCGGHGRGTSSGGTGDGLETAERTGGVGVSVPGEEGLVGAGGVVLGVGPGGAHKAGIGGVDGVTHSAEVSVVGVAGGGGVRCIDCGGDCHEEDRHEDGHEGEEVQCLLGTGFDPVAPEGTEVGLEVYRPEDGDDEGCAADRESCTCVGTVLCVEPADAVACEKPEHGEVVHGVLGVLAVVVEHPDAEDQREPEGEPSVVGGHRRDAGTAGLGGQ